MPQTLIFLKPQSNWICIQTLHSLLPLLPMPSCCSLVKYSKTYKNKVWNTDVLRLLKVELKPKGRLTAVRASTGKNRFLTKSLRLTKGFFFQYCHWYQKTTATLKICH